MLTSIDAVENDEAFVKIRDWIENYLQVNRHLDSFAEGYCKNREFFVALPDIFWALNYRRYGTLECLRVLS
jgi:ubiquitin carboxyl-terminal hydrolase 34